MHIEVISGRELDAGLVERWHEIRDTDPALESPFFCPEFTLAVAEARGDVFVGIMREGQDIVGFFPYQYASRGIGKPVGGLLADYQGAIVLPNVEWSASELIKDCRLQSWEFDHLIACQKAFNSNILCMTVSHVIDLDKGFNGYLDQMRGDGHGQITTLFRKQRKFVREHGGFDFRLFSDDSNVLAKVFEWKSAQCRRTGKIDYFSFGWTRELVERICHTQGPHFSGALSVILHKGRVAAAHFGMRSGNVLHHWFPVYDHAYSNWSPGKILLLRICEEGAAKGITRIDLGKGEDPYKRGFANQSVALAEGGVYGESFQAQTLRVRRHFAYRFKDSSIRQIVRESSAFSIIRPQLRAIRRAAGRMANWTRLIGLGKN